MQSKQIDIILRQNHKNFHKQRLFTHEYAHHPQPKSDSVLNVEKYTKWKSKEKKTLGWRPYQQYLQLEFPNKKNLQK